TVPNRALYQAELRPDSHTRSGRPRERAEDTSGPERRQDPEEIRISSNPPPWVQATRRRGFRGSASRQVTAGAMKPVEKGCQVTPLSRLRQTPRPQVPA